jgi:hypothetical protein
VAVLMSLREIIELVKTVGSWKAMHATVAIVLFAAALYVSWKYRSGYPPL